jgi:hypothetical protein
LTNFAHTKSCQKIDNFGAISYPQPIKKNTLNDGLQLVKLPSKDPLLTTHLHCEFFCFGVPPSFVFLWGTVGQLRFVKLTLSPNKNERAASLKEAIMVFLGLQGTAL